ncbi:MAG: hypothetical protein EOM02_02900 [Synergistales bacterium]|nr:hypothetical protein [Synergistales bacterium]
MNLSQIFAPVTKKAPAKLRDGRIISMVQGGFCLWNPNAQIAMRLPLGEMLDRKLESLLIESLSQWNPQRVSCHVPEGAMAVAVRQIKRSCQLPLLFVERRGDILEFQGYEQEGEDGVSQAMAVLRTVGIALAELGLSVRRIDKMVNRGVLCSLVSTGEPDDLGAQDGLRCPSCGWCGSPSGSMEFGGSPSDDPSDLVKVHTPGVGTIEDLCRFLSVESRRTVKTMFFSDDGGALTAVLIRGDRKVSLDKLSHWEGKEMHPASDQELRSAMGDLVGFLGPIGLPSDVKLVADSSVEGIACAVIGANERDFHMTGACWGRDFSAPVSDFALMEPGDLCPMCGEVLVGAALNPLLSLELWNGPADDEPSLTYVDEGKIKRKPFSWILKADMTQLAAALFRGAMLPRSLSPFVAMICPERPEDVADAMSMCSEIKRQGLEVLMDDRGLDPARSREDGDLMRIPYHCIVSGKSVQVRDWQGVISTTTLDNLRVSLKTHL